MLEALWQVARWWLDQDPCIDTPLSLTDFSLHLPQTPAYGIGSTFGGPHAPREVGTAETTSPHQSAGDESSDQGLPKVLPPFGCPSSADLTAGCSHNRENDCHCHPAVMPRPDSPHGMVPQPRDHEALVPPMGLSPYEAFCHKVENQLGSPTPL